MVNSGQQWWSISVVASSIVDNSGSQLLSQRFGANVRMECHFETTETGETAFFKFAGKNWFLGKTKNLGSLAKFQKSKNPVSAVSAVSKCYFKVIFALKH